VSFVGVGLLESRWVALDSGMSSKAHDENVSSMLLDVTANNQHTFTALLSATPHNNSLQTRKRLEMFLHISLHIFISP